MKTKIMYHSVSKIDFLQFVFGVVFLSLVIVVILVKYGLDKIHITKTKSTFSRQN